MQEGVNEDMRKVIVYGRETREVENEIKAWAEGKDAKFMKLDADWFNVLTRAPWCPNPASMVQVVDVVIAQAERDVQVFVLSYLLDPVTGQRDDISVESDTDQTQGFRVMDELASRLAALSTGGMQSPHSSQQTQPTATAAQVQPQTWSQSGAIAYPPQAVQGSVHSPSSSGTGLTFYCTSCGREVSEHSKFCNWCGSPVSGGSDESGYAQSQAQVRAPPVPQTPLPPPPAFAGVAPQGHGEVGKKGSWWSEHVGASRIYHCRTNGCGWSGTIDRMFSTTRFRDVAVPIMRTEHDGTSTPPQRISGYNYYTEEIRVYSCPKCDRAMKEKKVKTKLVRSSGGY